MTNRDLISDFLNQSRLLIIAKINRATGRTESALRVVTGSNYGYLFAPTYITNLESGRGPTQSEGGSKSGSLFENIQRWIAARGLRAENGNQDSLAWAITNSIHKKGTLLYREGKRSGVLSETLTDQRLKEFTERLAEVQLIEVNSQLLKNFKQNLS